MDILDYYNHDIAKGPDIQLAKNCDLEDIISNIKPRKKDTLELIFTDKCKMLKANVKALLEEINNRARLNIRLLDTIDNDIFR